MSEFHITVSIMLILCGCLLFVIPVLNTLPLFKAKPISQTWCIICVFICMALGCVVDLNHLPEAVKTTVLVGAFILAGLFIVLKYFGEFNWAAFREATKGSRARFEKGDMRFTLENTDESDKKEHHHGR